MSYKKKFKNPNFFKIAPCLHRTGVRKTKCTTGTHVCNLNKMRKKTFLREFMTVPVTFKDQLRIDQW